MCLHHAIHQRYAAKVAPANILSSGEVLFGADALSDEVVALRAHIPQELPILKFTERLLPYRLHPLHFTYALIQPAQ